MSKLFSLVAIVIITIFLFTILKEANRQFSNKNDHLFRIKSDYGTIMGRCKIYNIDSNRCIHYFDVDENKEKIFCGDYSIE